MYANKKRGFTLIELSVVIVILGLIIGTLAPLMMSMIKKDKIKDAKTIVKRAKDEIIGYVISKKQLPEKITNLGHYKDPWGNRLFLMVADDLKKNDICAKNSTKLSFWLFGPSGACNNKEKIKNIAFIIGSKGPDFNRQVSRRKRTNKKWIVKGLDYGCKGDFYPKDGKKKNVFDDIIEYVTLNELKGSVCKLLSGHGTGGSSSSGNSKQKPKPKMVISPKNRQQLSFPLGRSLR